MRGSLNGRMISAFAAGALAVLTPVVAHAESPLDAWGRVTRDCKSVGAFRAKFSKPNPRTGDADALWRVLNCAERKPAASADLRRPSADKPGRARGAVPPNPQLGRATPRPAPLGPTPAPISAIAAGNLALADQASIRGDHREAQQYFKRSCDDDSEPRGCNAYGLSLSNSEPINYGATDPAASRRYFERACDRSGNAAYCNNARIANSYAIYGEVDPGRVRRYYEMSKFFIGDIKCDKDGGVGCEVLGRGFLVSPVRPDSSEMIFTTGCNGGSAESCLGVGRLLTERTNRSLFHLSTAAGFFAQGCTLGSRAACTAGRVLRSNAAFGVLDLRKARTLFEREGGQVGAVECAAYGADACYNLGLAYELPEFGTPDRTRAKAFMAGACTAKFAKGCADLGRIEQQAGRNAPALAAYELGCTYGDRPGSCNSAAELRRYLAEVEQITRRNAQICAASRRNPC